MNPAYRGVKFRYLILWLVLTVIALFIGGFIYLETNGDPSLTNVILFSQFAIYGVLFLWLRRAYRKNDLDLKGVFQPIRKSNGLIKKLLFTVFHISFSLSIAVFLFYLFSLVVPDFVFNLLEDGASTNAFMAATVIPSFILIVIVAPIVEELIFRATLLQKLRVRFGTVAGILISSAIFSLIHMNSGMIGHFTIGIFLSIFYLQTKNIWVPILCHALNNLIAFSSARIDAGGEMDFGQAVSEIQQVGPYVGIYAFFCLGFLIWLAIKLIRKLNTETLNVSGEKVV